MDAKARLVEGGPNPRPQEGIEDADQAPLVRRLHCRRYDDCLDVAIEARWRSFTCAACKAFEPLTADGEERDMRGLVQLAAEFLVANDNSKKAPLPQEGAEAFADNKGEEK